MANLVLMKAFLGIGIFPALLYFQICLCLNVAKVLTLATENLLQLSGEENFIRASFFRNCSSCAGNCRAGFCVVA
jgi:hypothetical protein